MKINKIKEILLMLVIKMTFKMIRKIFNKLTLLKILK